LVFVPVSFLSLYFPFLPSTPTHGEDNAAAVLSDSAEDEVEEEEEESADERAVAREVSSF